VDLLAVATVAAVIFGALWLLTGVVRRLLERRATADARRPVPEAWLGVVHARLPYLAALPPDDRDRLLRHARGLLATVTWEGAGGLALTDEMRLVIAAQAALLTWKRDDLPFPRLKTVLVYPTTFRPAAKFEWVRGPTRERETPELGESWPDGTIVLAWDDVVRGATAPHDGHNVVLHEFAHQLDSANGLSDGVPTLPAGLSTEAWQGSLDRAYRELERSVAAGADSPVDSYGLTNRAEFFAVATEAFFERPAALRSADPDLYRRLTELYAQDPALLVG